MENQLVGKGNFTSKEIPFGEYFIKHENIEKNINVKDSINYLSDKYNKQSLAEESKETALDNIINQQLSGKNMKNFKRKNSRFLSSKEINKELRESLKNIGVLKKSEEEENLLVRKMKSISEQEYEEKVLINLGKEEMINKLYSHLKSVTCNFKTPYSNSSLGGISPLTFLIESFYAVNKEKSKEMNDKYNLLSPYIYNFRTINGDGNCFYRATIFRYLEIIVLNKKKDILRNVIYDVMISFQSEELKKRRIISNNDIKPDLTIKILVLILDLLKKNLVSEAHQILIKCFCTCRKFDYCLILYFRYILYKYIKENENKIYLKSFPIKIGNLLPIQYETEKGEFLFNSFYENYLLKFYTDAEKIIIYLSPFVLGVELNVVVFDIAEQDVLQKFIYEGESDIKIDDIITLLNNRNHYEIVYSQKDNEKYKNYFQFYENNIQSKILDNIGKYLLPKKENYDEDENKKDFKQISFSKLQVSTINDSETKMTLKKEYINIQENQLGLNQKSNEMINKVKNEDKEEKINNNIIGNKNLINNLNYNKIINNVTDKLNDFNTKKQINTKINNLNKNDYNVENLKNKIINNNDISQNNFIPNKTNLINCSKCKKKIILNNKKYLFCDNCLKQTIFNEYLDCIQNKENPIDYLFDEKKYNLDKLIQIYNMNFKDNLEKQSLIKNINDRKCLFKEECSKDNHKKLPCQCELCEHFIKYFGHFNFKKHFICVCLTNYSRKKMIKLGILFSNISEEIFNKIIQYFQERTSNNCCIEEEKLLNKEKNNCFYFQSSDYEILKLNQYSLNNFLSKIEHYVCSNCIKKMPKKFHCKICDIIHFIQSHENK